MWLGPYRQAGYEWDVIVFNFGLGDLNTESSAYRAALKSIVPQLRATKAKLIWLSTTPLPNGWEANPTSTGKKMSRIEAQAKIKELNAIASEEVKTAKDVLAIDLSSAIESELETRFANWSSGRSPMFNREQSELMAKQLGQILESQPTKNEDQ
jgi:acyl-CoA thioesterase-1